MDTIVKRAIRESGHSNGNVIYESGHNAYLFSKSWKSFKIIYGNGPCAKADERVYLSFNLLMVKMESTAGESI